MSESKTRNQNRFNITGSEELIQFLDEYAEKHGMTRSRAAASILADFFTREQGKEIAAQDNTWGRYRDKKEEEKTTKG